MAVASRFNEVVAANALRAAEEIEDDRLRLIFTCCHPAIAREVRWDSQLIAEGQTLVEQALQTRRFSAYSVQAAIAAVHASASVSEATDWPQIVALYDALQSINPSPVVELNRAVAVAMRDGADAGLKNIEAILDRGELTDYHLAHAARADLCRRAGRIDAARAAYQHALSLAKQEPERRFLMKRLGEL